MAERKQLLQQADVILQAREDALFQAHEDLPLDASPEEMRNYMNRWCERVIQDFPLTPAQQQAIQQRAMGVLQ
jgi:hypothetical protein